MTELARLLDRDALQAEEGPRGRVRVTVPRGWASARATIVVQAPARVRCAACEGGGCDACQRSGVFRLAERPEERTFRVTLPAELGEGRVLRIAAPFGAGGPLAQVLCELREGDAPEGCWRVATADRGPLSRAVVSTGVALLLAAGVAVAWLATR